MLTANENVYELKKYKQVNQPTMEWVPIETFLKLPPVFCQRQTNFRAPKIKRLLKKKFYQSHLDVAIFEYSCGKRVRGNGNTRAVCFEGFQDEGLFHLIPAYVNATIYPVKNDEEAKALYYTFDSDESVEKAPDKITGVFRALNLSFNNKKIAKGGIGKALEFASSGRDSNSNAARNLDWFTVIGDFKDELVKLDSIKLKKSFDSHLICASLMMLKRHGVTNTLLMEGLLKLNSGAKGAQCPKNGTDGITYILEEWTTHRIFDQLGTDGISFPRQQDFLLYCFEKWMDEEHVRQYRRPSERKKGRGKGCRKNAYESFWDNEENQ